MLRLAVALWLIVFSISADARNAIDLIGTVDLRDRTARAELASVLFQKVEVLANLLPKLRPMDQAWLDDERVAIRKLPGASSSIRLRALIESREYHHERLQMMLNEIRGALNCSSQIRNAVRREVACWSVAAYYLSADEIYEDVPALVKAKLLPDELIFGKGGESASAYGLYHLIGRGIYSNIVIPYLNGAFD